MKRLMIVIAICLFAVTARAIDTDRAFDDPELQARYEAIIAEVRCLKCQNQSIKDSNAFLAADLRREIRRLIEEGKTDAEIYDFLVARYGEFALYRPRGSWKARLLWIAPGILVFAGAFIFVIVLRRRSALPIDDDQIPDR